MSQPQRPLLARASFWLVTLLLLLAAGLVAWFAIPEYARYTILSYLGVDTNAVRLTFEGKVVDAAGKPAEGAHVRGTWKTRGAESEGRGLFDAVCDAEGKYRHVSWFHTEDLKRAKDLSVQVTMQAHGRFFATEPSAPATLAVAARGTVATDFRLGAALPTVKVLVRDRDDKPVEEFWIETLPESEGTPRPAEWPSAWKDFPLGVVHLAVPKERFRIHAYRHGGVDATTVGPFDPKAPPPEITIRLAASK